jgi:hypothetical protein
MADTINEFKRNRLRYPGKLDAGVTQFVGDVWPPAYVENTNSISLDGTTEYLANTTVSSLFNSLDYTVACWAYKTADITVNYGALVGIKEASGNVERILLQTSSTNQGRQDNAIYPTTGSRHFIRYESTWTTQNVWVFVVITHDGAGDVTTFYVNDVDRGSDTDSEGFSTADRQLHRIGQTFPGYIHSVAYWDTVLDTDNLTAVYNGADGNFDLNVDAGNYDTSGNLLAWYRLGADDSSDTALGYNYSAVTADKDVMNCMDNAANVTTADVVAASPT